MTKDFHVFDQTTGRIVVTAHVYETAALHLNTGRFIILAPLDCPNPPDFLTLMHGMTAFREWKNNYDKAIAFGRD